MHSARILPPLLLDPDIAFGFDALPLFSLHAKNIIAAHADSVDKIILFVSDFRYGNELFLKHKKPESFYIDDNLDDRFRCCGCESYSSTSREAISPETDLRLYENGLKILDEYILQYQDKITFIFWDLNIREAKNIEKNKYMVNGFYCHPVWSYSYLVNRYKENTLDVSIIRKDFKNFTFDEIGHASYKGYVFLWNLIKTKDSGRAFAIAQKEVDPGLARLFPGMLTGDS